MSRIVRAEAGLFTFELDTPVGGSGVAAVDVIIVDLESEDGATGLGFSYILGGGGGVAFAAAKSQVETFLQGKPVLPPPALWRQIYASFNRTGLGPNLVALAALDVAAWDLEARRRDLPLGVAMGGASRSVPVYASGGFTALQSPEQAAEAASAHAARGLTAVKPRARGQRVDAALLAAVRAAVGDDRHVMIDANEKCDLPSALWLTAAARDAGALFVEEPLPSHALSGYRALARAGGAPVATGEHLQAQGSFLPFISEGLASLVQPDLAMVGGLTPALEIARLAAAFDVGVAPHFLPGLFVHLAAAAPNLSWLEEFPLLEPAFDGWPVLDSEGRMEPGASAGHGLALAPRYRETLQR